MNETLPPAPAAAIRRPTLLRAAAAWGVVAGLGVCVAAGGCAKQGAPKPLTADAFVVRQNDPANGYGHPLDRNPAAMYNNVRVPILPEDQRPEGQEVTGISQAVKDGRAARDQRGQAAPTTQGSVETVDLTAPAPADATAPATAPAEPFPTGTYQELGNVLAVVNGRPIYAHKVLARIDNVLAAEARRNPPQAFRVIARQKIIDQRDELIRDELEFAAAEKNLSERERELAKYYTMMYRDRLITEAGGAEAVARRKAAEEGQSFDDKVQDQYRLLMAQIYNEKKVAPRIAVSATDIRRFYDANKQTLYTQPGGIKFRLIQVDPSKQPGGADQAYNRAQELRRRAQSEDFATLAAAQKDSPWSRNEGLAGSKDQDWWVQKGAFALEKVEAALWGLQPGQVSDVIQDRGGYYVARLEERRDGTVRPFDLTLQEEIRRRLRAEQFQALHQRMMGEMMRGAIVHENREMLDVAVEMAMQRYPRWAAAREEAARGQ